MLFLFVFKEQQRETMCHFKQFFPKAEKAEDLFPLKFAAITQVSNFILILFQQVECKFLFLMFKSLISQM